LLVGWPVAHRAPALASVHTPPTLLGLRFPLDHTPVKLYFKAY